ncbi:MAG: hypothetical protein A2Y03_11530 [Omnitrophica WOR_2 bacterium GWF2_38_59]|nr:MAG: hypothetical protein A2Y06_00170 [Omnitrophica WOR_2 bacterium GWA2_37_7]OGX25305.1 MAG: hypothetical protein A2Y03_11530 [Omnitrophica WOR_2 bacterium GWF2_38_59]OGX47976.1 MAG: hypothetical protein A2243_01385 [Omnitrophica WOR_2 bacterium RIFOXYA2_FULL_38_17]HBG61094.1 hypothetical protein [Candidatus Omnitrophota bacterium]
MIEYTKRTIRIFLVAIVLSAFVPVCIMAADASLQESLNTDAGSEYAQQAVLDVLDLKQIEVLDVLKLISQKSGLNIIASNNVSGRITVYLKDMSVLEVLSVIVDSNGWAYVRENNVIKVMTAKEYESKYGYKFGQEIQTRIVQLIYANTADLVAILNQVRSSSGKVIADEKTGTLILMDESVKLDEMEDIVKRVDVPVETKIFDLSYAKAEGISAKIAEVLSPSLGTMRFDKRSNTVIVSDSKSKIKEVTQIVEAFDKQNKEVLIEAKILQIVLSDEHKMGVDWEAIVSDFHGLSLNNDFDILGPSDKKGHLSIGTIANDDYTVLIEALDTVGVTDILSSPRITTINNEEAKILVGSTEPYVTSTTTTPSSGPTTTAESVNFIEVGVKLYVTPTIHNDGFITMKIKPEISSVTGEVTTSNNNTIPVVETSEAETNVMVKDGVTIVIGGLIKEEKIRTTKKVPLLGNIPFLGNAFKNESDKVSKTEIVLFLTPHIISGDVPAPELDI